MAAGGEEPGGVARGGPVWIPMEKGAVDGGVDFRRRRECALVRAPGSCGGQEHVLIAFGGGGGVLGRCCAGPGIDWKCMAPGGLLGRPTWIVAHCWGWFTTKYPGRWTSVGCRFGRRWWPSDGALGAWSRMARRTSARPDGLTLGAALFEPRRHLDGHDPPESVSNPWGVWVCRRRTFHAFAEEP